ncbi:MAG TPA: glycosyltransferase [Solirubrobacteraceae bacterium]|jgi:GT2 family glycosyltransferase|nr:glycosyltransferase [Solirubrobacteraceae bacterium]
MDGVDVSVCVPVYRAHAEPNLATVAATMGRALGGLRGELIVALNGVSTSAAGAPEWARTVDLGINRGVAPGWNAAAAAASGAVLVFANDDLALGEGSLRLMHDALLAHPEAGVVGPDGTRWDLRVPKHLERLDLSGLAPGELRSCDVVAGYLFAARREVFDAVGGFDEAYAPCSMEEVDFCTTVRKRLGLECCAIAGVRSDHEYQISIASPWRRIRHNGRAELLRSVHVRNRRHFKRKWRGVV